MLLSVVLMTSLYLPVADGVFDMRTTFLHLVDLLGVDALFSKETLGAAGCQYPEAALDQNTDCGQYAVLVVVAHRDEDGAGARQVDAGAELALGEGECEIGVEADDFAGRAHFRSEQNVDAGEAGERENGFLDGDVLQVARVGFLAVSGNRRIKLLAGHDAGSNLGDRRTDGFCNEGHRARGARVDFENVDRAVLDRVLNVHQATDVERLCKRRRLAFQFVERFLAQRTGRQRAGRVARVDTGFFDVLHDARHEDAFAVTQCIDVDFDGVGQVAVEQKRVLAEQGVDLAGLVVRVTLLDILGHEARNRVE